MAPLKSNDLSAFPSHYLMVVNIVYIYIVTYMVSYFQTSSHKKGPASYRLVYNSIQPHTTIHLSSSIYLPSVAFLAKLPTQTTLAPTCAPGLEQYLNLGIVGQCMVLLHGSHIQPWFTLSNQINMCVYPISHENILKQNHEIFTNTFTIFQSFLQIGPFVRQVLLFLLLDMLGPAAALERWSSCLLAPSGIQFFRNDSSLAPPGEGWCRWRNGYLVLPVHGKTND